MWNLVNVLVNDLLMLAVISMMLQSHFMSGIFYWRPYTFMSWFFCFSYFITNFETVNVDNFFKGHATRNNFSMNKFLNYDSFIYHDVNFFNKSHTNVLSSSDRHYPFSFYFCKYSFLYTVFLMIYMCVYVYIYKRFLALAISAPRMR